MWINTPDAAKDKYPPIKDWDVSRVTDMREMFGGEPHLGGHTFNEDIGEWDVSQVTDMGFMFGDNSKFNAPIGEWDVSQVTDMERMFRRAAAFGADIGAWDVSKVTDMSWMFNGGDWMGDSPFDADIGEWDTSSVTAMDSAFTNSGLCPLCGHSQDCCDCPSWAAGWPAGCGDS